MMKHRDLCDCHSSPRVYKPWMESFWRGLSWVFGFTVKNQHPVLVHCGTFSGAHGHPYRDDYCVETPQGELFAKEAP